MADTSVMGQAALARAARTHAIRAVALSWAMLSAVLAATLAVPHGWFDFFIPFGWFTAILVAIVVAAAIVLLLPLERVGDEIVAELRADATGGRLRNVAEEVSIAIGEASGHVVIHEAEIPNVGAFPTADGVVVMATTGAVEQLDRDELEALVAAQFAGMRDRWCRLATRAELAWTLTIVLGFVSILFALPVAWMIGGAMVFLPRSVEATRDLCADVAAVRATRHPAALANALRHLAPAASDGNKQRLVRRWYLPVSPFLVMPKRMQSTTSVSGGGRPTRKYTDADEVASELRLRADRAEASPPAPTRASTPAASTAAAGANSARPSPRSERRRDRVGAARGRHTPYLRRRLPTSPPSRREEPRAIHDDEVGIRASKQNASAVVARAAALQLGDELDGIVTYDDRLADAAVQLGIPVVTPA